MRDRLALLATAVVAAALSWAGWHALGAQALDALGLVTTGVLAVDNARLRRQLRRLPRDGP
jgi:hypothetical protein